MVDVVPLLRPKNTSRPSGVNAGAESCAVPETMPGANTTGVCDGPAVAADAASSIQMCNRIRISVSVRIMTLTLFTRLERPLVGTSRNRRKIMQLDGKTVVV